MAIRGRRRYKNARLSFGKAHVADFKLTAIDLSNQEGNRAAAWKLGINESMVRHGKHHWEELIQETTEAFRGHMSRWPESWLDECREQPAEGPPGRSGLKAQTIAREMCSKDFTPWCFRLMTTGSVHQDADGYPSATPSPVEENVANSLTLLG